MAVSRLAESVVGPALGLPKSAVSRVTIPLLSVAPIGAAFRIVMNWKAKFVANLLFSLELDGKEGEKARIESANKVVSIAVCVLAGVMALQGERFLGRKPRYGTRTKGVGSLQYIWKKHASFRRPSLLIHFSLRADPPQPWGATSAPSSPWEAWAV